jgi:hypothetical protein
MKLHNSAGPESLVQGPESWVPIEILPIISCVLYPVFCILLTVHCSLLTVFFRLILFPFCRIFVM